MRSGVRVIEYGVVEQSYGWPPIGSWPDCGGPVAMSASATDGENSLHAGNVVKYVFTSAGGGGGAAGSSVVQPDTTSVAPSASPRLRTRTAIRGDMAPSWDWESGGGRDGPPPAHPCAGTRQNVHAWNALGTCLWTIG